MIQEAKGFQKFINFFIHIKGTTVHKYWVFLFTLKFVIKLLQRGITHDLSKYHPVEIKDFQKVIHLLPSLKFGSPEYIESKSMMQNALAHHYANSRHHPEYWLEKHNIAEGINCMSLVDIVEMFLDWQASVKRLKNGDIFRSIEINKKNFNISEQLCCILRNTIDKDYTLKQQESR